MALENHRFLDVFVSPAGNFHFHPATAATGPPRKTSKPGEGAGVRSGPADPGLTLEIEENLLDFDPTKHLTHDSVDGFLHRVNKVREDLNSGRFHRSSSHTTIESTMDAIRQAEESANAHRMTLGER